MDFSECDGDATFGPSVLGCRDDFDFTITFEKAILSILPAALFIVFSLLRAAYLIRRPSIVQNATLKISKLIVALAYTALQLSLLVLSANYTWLRSLSVASASLTFVAGLCTVALSVLEQMRAPRPSMLLTGYLLLTLLLDIAQTRTVWLATSDQGRDYLPQVWTVSTVLKAALLLLEAQSKARWISWNAEKHSPEELTGLFGLGAFFWLNQLFFAGYKRVLQVGDLFPLDQSMATEALQQRFLESTSSSDSNERKSSKRKNGTDLAKALLQTLRTPILLPVGPRLALLTFKFCQPFLMRTLLDFLQRQEDKESKNLGLGLIAATVLIYLGIASSTSFYWYFHERALCMSRGCLVSAIYKKTTESRLSAASDAAAITLMSSDVERIRLGFLNLHEFWANMIEVALASWLLERQLGTAFAAPLVVVICCIVAGAYTNRFTGQRQMAWMRKIQKRVGLTASIVAHMKHLKISGLARPVERLIQQMRVEELETASKFRIIYVLVVTFGYVPTALCPVMTFAFTSRILDVSTIFTSMSYILLLADPLGYLFQNTPNLIAAFACLDRIQTFLDLEPWNDYRIETALRSGKPDLENCSKADNIEDTSDYLIDIRHGQFGWAPDKPVLSCINLCLLRGSLTMIVGPIGSGKSTLCHAILGETPFFDGTIVAASGVLSRKVGYCDQSPYLTNTTIRKNIIGASHFDAQRYQEVVIAAALDQDLSDLPLGDLTQIGSDGVALSGGQRQRVSMARALYLDTDFFIIDDILSGLDAETADRVFRNIFGVDGYLKRRNATVLLCTHNIKYMPFADHVVALNANGTIMEQGNPRDIMSKQSYIHDLETQYNSGYQDREPFNQQLKRNDHLSDIPAASTGAPASIEMEGQNRMNGDPTVYRYYFSTLGTRSFIAFIVFGLGWGFFYNWGNVWLKFWSEDVSSTHPRRSNSFYIGLYALFQTTYVLSMFFVFLICFTSMIQLSGSKLHQAALRTMIGAPLTFFGTTDTGLVTNMFSQDMTLIDHELPIAVTNLALDICNALGMAAVIASSSPYLAITYPFLFVVLYGIQKFYLRTSRQLRLLDLEAKSPLYTNFLDTMKGLATFRAFGWTQEGIHINTHLLDTSQRPTYLLAIVQRWLLFSLQCVVTVLAVAVVAMSTQLRSNTALTGASLVTLMTFGDILNYIIRWFTQLETSIGAVSRLKNFSEKVRPETTEIEDQTPSNDWPLSGSIEINDISASYAATRSTPKNGEQEEVGWSSANLAIRNMTLSIRPGEKVAICGRSGSGKSSTIMLLLKLLNPLPSCSGSIVIDGLPLHNIDRATLRERIIAIPQQAVFLPDGSTVMENMDPHKASNEGECRTVLELVGLWGLFSQRGGLAQSLLPSELSQGQKQLFNLARAVLRHRIRLRGLAESPGPTREKTVGGILLLDEVSSSVDQDTDRSIQQVIMGEFQDYTIVMVSHRLEMVMNFDTVVIMDQGTVVETGAPRTLAVMDESRFGQLWRIGGRAQR
ncbi:hypothetical protein JX265_012293 [Neoarthrinium moseri]|uniref:ABC transporter n=1 Tax=Neoarthrinium moseri TaxID=1658444 RepID=A0A9Q0AGW1_9PEZI|nr:hypothetical protein JX265_012293 [Neoarthrinium moseri]